MHKIFNSYSDVRTPTSPSTFHRAKPDDVPTVHRTKAVRKLQWAREASVQFSVKGLSRHPTIATKLYICDKIQWDGNDCNSSARARGIYSARVGRLLETRGISLRSVEILNCGGPLAGWSFHVGVDDYGLLAVKEWEWGTQEVDGHCRLK